MSLCVFDTETDSPNPLEAHIVSAYLGILDPAGNVIKEQTWIVKPEGFVIPEEAIAIHGITNEEALATGVALSTVLSQICDILQAECVEGGLPLGGQNVVYDLTVLHEEWRRDRGGILYPFLRGLKVLDSLVLDKRINKYRKGTGARRLINLAAAYGVTLTEEEAHGARSDAMAAGRIILKQFQNDLLRGMPLDVVHEAQVHWFADQAADLENWFRTKCDPPKPDFVADRGWPLHSSLTVEVQR